MKLIACLVTIALLLSSFAAFADPINAQDIRPLNQSEDVPLMAATVADRAQDPELAKHFRRYDLVKFDRDAAAKRVKNRGRMILETSHGNFDLEFAPNDLRSSDYSSQEIGADGVAHKLTNTPVTTFRATVKDDPGAQARMSVGADGPEGAIITGTGKYFIEPARGLSKTAQPDEFVFYSFDDVADSDTECGVTLADEVAAQQQVAAASDETGVAEAISSVTPISPMAIVRLATDADGEYVNGLGGTAAAGDRILQIMNVVDGIYQVEIGVTFQIVFQNFWTNAGTDPYTNAEAGARLDQFKAHWNGRTDGGFGTARSLAHLWTGIDLTGTTIGIASLSAVCRFPEDAYGLSQRFPLTGASNAATSILTAHEIGHNFSAAHTNQIGRDVPAELLISCDNSIMESGLGSRTGSSFCTFSRSQIVGHATAYGSSCLLSGGTPPANNCSETPVTSGVPIDASLSNSDCRSQVRGTPHFADQYTFNGIAGQQITIRMDQISGALDPYLYLIGPDGMVVDQAEFSDGGVNARIPEFSPTNVFTLPQTGKYIIEATSSQPGQTGNYQLRFTRNGCTLTATPSALSFPAGGGTASLTISEFGNCFGYGALVDSGTAGTSWINVAGPSVSNATRVFSVNVSANGNSIGRRSFVLIAPSGNVLSGGGTSSDIGGLRIPITQAGTGPACSVTPISIGQTLNGNLGGGDCESPIRNNTGLRADRYTFTASAGQQFAIGLTSTTFDCFLTLIGPNGAVLLNDDDGGGGQNSRIPGGTGMLTAGVPGTYTIEVSSFSANQSGNYSLTTAGTTPNWQPTVLNASQVALKSWKQSDGHTYVYAKLTFPDAGFLVTNWGTPVRSGNTFTVDTRVERFNGVSAQAISNTAQIWDLGVIDPGNYTFNFQNSGTTVQTLNFTVSATAPPPNPIDDAHQFVRQQYLDFLRREPDLPGWAHWEGEITQCSDPAFRLPGETEAKCIDRKRDNTSAAFFLSPEFQNTGYFVLRVYRGSLGRMPHFGGGNGPTDEFTRDAATVSAGIVVNDALAPNVMNANKQAFVNEFVTRAEFRALYDGLNNTQYVDKLFQTTGVVPSATDRQALIDGLNGGESRASVLFKVVDGTNTVAEGHLEFNTTYGKAFYDQQFNAAFVQMEYFGYLQRDPDPEGYAFWLAKLNLFNDWQTAEMVRAFIVSPEYRSRFGAP
jgi:Metallo-peptidase family M12/Bacterial pre-peptidase C-terminal domain/Domain of unknown function (DUF4214)